VISLAAPSPSTVVEGGDSGSTTLVFPVSFDTTPSAPVTVSYQTNVNGTITNGSLALGTSNGAITVNVANDNLSNGSESVTVTLTGVTAGGSGAALGGATVATGTVTEDDGAATPVVLYRVNAGGAQVAASANDPYGSTLAWAANTANEATSGTGYTVNTGRIGSQTVAGRATSGEYAVPDYVPQGLFSTERHDRPVTPEMVFQFGQGQLAAGTYTVHLFAGDGFSGTTAVGQRVFSVNVEGQTVSDWGNNGNVDLNGLLGHGVGGMFTWTGTVTDGTLNIGWAHGVENPLVSAIEVIQGSVDTLI